MRAVNAEGVGMASMSSDPVTAQAVAGNFSPQKVEDYYICVSFIYLHQTGPSFALKRQQSIEYVPFVPWKPKWVQ